MSDYRDQLERERRKFVMRDGTLESLRRRRDRKRRNGQIVAGIVALLIAAAGIGGGLFALRGGEKLPPTHQPTPTTGPAGGSVGVSPVSAPLQFVDDQHGWVVDEQGQIQATRDGGQTWNVQLAGPSNIKAIEFVDRQHGWGVGEGGLIHTSDGGEHWVTWSNEPLLSIQFKDEQVGWGIRLDSRKQAGPGGPVVKTMDAGRTWTTQGIAADSICYAPDGNTENLWAAGPGEGGMSFMRSTDGGGSWGDQPIRIPEGGPWTASLQCIGSEVWVRLTDGGAAGHNPYGVFQSVDYAPARLVMQEAGTRPFGHQEGVYESQDPYPGPFAAVGPGAAYFLNWCPACGGGPQPSVSITITGGDPAAVADRFPVVTGDRQGEPVGISLLAPKNGEDVPSLGWALVNVHGPKGPTATIWKTTDGGRTWAEIFGPGS